MNSIRNAFENGKALAAYFTCGDPDLETTAEAVRAAAENGADIIELGIPFSDPTAEAPVIQASSVRALENGVTTDKVFEFIKELRKDVDKPFVLVTYANVVFTYGAERFMQMCSETGTEGLFVLDLPFEEKDEFAPEAEKYGIVLISSVASASGERIAMISSEAQGMIMVYPSESMMKAGGKCIADPAEIVEVIRENTDTPCIIASGIFDAAGAEKAASAADGAATDEKLALIMEKYGKEAPRHVGEYIRSVKNAMI